MSSLGAAVVGTGFIGPVHVEAIRRLGHRVVGILGSNLAKSQAIAHQLQIETAYGSYDELLSDSSVQVVHLASPNRVHFTQCQKALQAGKHVICEKPLGMTTAETRELVRLAEASPLITAVNYNVRFYPLVLEARERCQAGQLGDIWHVTGSYLQDWLLFPTDFNWRVLAQDGGELRAVADIGTHWLDTVQFITGLELEAVCADLATLHTTRLKPFNHTETFTSSSGRVGQPAELFPITTEDYGSILLRFRGGVKGCLTVSQMTAGRKNCIRFDIAGSRSALAWDSEEPNAMQIGHRERPNESVGRDPGLLAAGVRPFAEYPAGHAEGFPDTFKQLYKAVYADIIANTRTTRPLYATFADGHREVVFCEAVLTSHREQRWVTLAD